MTPRGWPPTIHPSIMTHSGGCTDTLHTQLQRHCNPTRKHTLNVHQLLQEHTCNFNWNLTYTHPCLKKGCPPGGLYQAQVVPSREFVPPQLPFVGLFLAFCPYSREYLYVRHSLFRKRSDDQAKKSIRQESRCHKRIVSQKRIRYVAFNPFAKHTAPSKIALPLHRRQTARCWLPLSMRESKLFCHPTASVDDLVCVQL